MPTEKIKFYCPMCGAEPGAPCTVVSGGEGEKPGDIRADPHWARSNTKPAAVLIPDEPAPRLEP